MSAWHGLATKCRRLADRSYAPGFLLRPLSYVLAFMGSASPRPVAKNYLAPERMQVGFGPGFRALFGAHADGFLTRV